MFINLAGQHANHLILKTQKYKVHVIILLWWTKGITVE